ncbi:histidine triad nucleotide-binding protein [Thiorhodospira sibirica]|uniref:histidine triad nucleotide-binding protein n=1 Tax=Thiorhodospira sibirica TaxID=154347 RepID=UPI00022C17C6|nr:histidine triad nucleotide-binding protein [Thiorhodospira sibirica]
MTECIFCKIITGDIPAKIIYETPELLAFHDLNPQAPLHALIIPRKHIATLNDLTEADAPLLGQMYLAAQHIAAQAGFAERGYRCVINCNLDGGQSVYHIHLHLLAGRKHSWPPG